MLVRLTMGGEGKKYSLKEVNARINELLKHSIQSEGVINLFSDADTEFSLFDPKFLEEVARMKEKNLAVELLKKLLAEQVTLTRELTEALRKSRTIDWQKKETARAGMRKMVRRLLRRYKYPPDGLEDAVQTVISQCEMWTDNVA